VPRSPVLREARVWSRLYAAWGKPFAVTRYRPPPIAQVSR
jgi:hypothetical protein